MSSENIQHSTPNIQRTSEEITDTVRLEWAITNIYPFKELCFWFGKPNEFSLRAFREKIDEQILEGRRRKAERI